MAAEERHVIAERVAAAVDDRRRRDHLRAQRAQLAEVIASRTQEDAAARAALAAEQRDVVALESFSFTRVWSGLRGDTDERLGRERAEAQQAEYVAAAAAEKLQRTLAEDQRLQTELAGLGDVDAEYAHALAAQEAWHASRGDSVAQELVDNARRRGDLNAERREVAEAIHAAVDASRVLNDAQERLRSAGGWSTYDTFFGGGFIADMVKHSKIDHASRGFADVDRALDRLSTELRDLKLPSVRGVDVGELLGTFDVLFDNIFSDWMVRGRIQEAQERSGAVYRALHSLIDTLTAQLDAVTAELLTLEERREHLLAQN